MEALGEDFALSSTIFRLDLGLSDGSSRRAVIKFAPATPTQREMGFYEHCAAETPLRVPGFISGNVDREADRGVVLLEYLPDVRQGDVLAGCTRKEALTLAAMLARLHAHWWGGDHPALNALKAGDESGASGPSIREGRLKQFLDRHGASLSAALLERVEGLPHRLDTANQHLQAGPRTLIHRDFHLDNLLFAPSGEPFVIDWQGATAGPPATDVARFLVECMTREQRRLFGAVALEGYLHQLGTSGVRPGAATTNQILAALDLLLAGTINWLGKTPPDPPNTRKGVLGRNLLRNIADTITSLSGWQ